MNSLNGSENSINYLSEAPYAELYELRGDAFAHAARLEEMAMAAAAGGFKTFKKMYKEYCRNREHMAAKSYAGNTTEFEGQPMELETGVWRADDIVISRGRGVDETVACVHPIMPVQRMVNVDTGIEKLELAFRRGRTWRRIIVDKRTLASANSIVSLSDNGVAVTSESARALVQYIHDTENLNYDILPEKPSVGRLGHISGYGFSPYVESLVFDGDEQFRSIFQAVRPEGDLQEWINHVRDLRAYSLSAKIVISAAFASALVEPFGLLPFYVHLWGTTSGTGKTVALMAAASVWAEPMIGRYIKTFDSTGVGLEVYAGFLNSLPMIIDELQLARDDHGNSKHNIYKLAEGVGRLRSNKARGIDRTITWRNCMITSGETPITQGNSGAGALNRVIDIECNDEAQKVIEDGRATAAFLRTHYGAAGRAFIDMLTPAALERYHGEYNEIVKELSAGDATDKQALSAAIIITADRMVSEWFFHDQPISASDMIGFLQTNASVDINQRAYDWICDWVAQNSNRLRKENENTECYGILDGSWVYIIRSIFTKAVEGEGFSSRGFLGWLKRKGIIETRGRNLTCCKRIGGIRTECIHMRLPEEVEVPF